MQVAPKLREILNNFLQSNPSTFYPPIEARILQLNPLQITDDNESYFDINSLQEEINAQVVQTPGAAYKLLLHSWRFVFHKVPNSHDYYFDIVSDNYQVVQTVAKPNDAQSRPLKVVDTADVRYFFEERKRMEIESIIRIWLI